MYFKCNIFILFSFFFNNSIICFDMLCCQNASVKPAYACIIFTLNYTIFQQF